MFAESVHTGISGQIKKKEGLVVEVVGWFTTEVSSVSASSVPAATVSVSSIVISTLVSVASAVIIVRLSVTESSAVASASSVAAEIISVTLRSRGCNGNLQLLAANRCPSHNLCYMVCVFERNLDKGVVAVKIDSSNSRAWNITLAGECPSGESAGSYQA